MPTIFTNLPQLIGYGLVYITGIGILACIAIMAFTSRRPWPTHQSRAFVTAEPTFRPVDGTPSSFGALESANESGKRKAA